MEKITQAIYLLAIIHCLCSIGIITAISYSSVFKGKT